MSTPSFKEMMEAWHTISKAGDPYLDSLTTETLLTDLPHNGKSIGQTRGDALQRQVYHFWFHLGEILSIRQMIGRKDLPEFVGDLEEKAPYRRE